MEQHSFNSHIPGQPIGVGQYQNVYVLDVIGIKHGGGGANWSYKMCKAPVKSARLSTGPMSFLLPNQQ